MKKVFSLLIVCAVAVSAMAIPARRGGMVRTAADGTEKTVYLHGNAFSHYMTDAEGNWLDEKTLEPLTPEQKAARVQKNEARSKMRRVQQEKMVGTTPNLAPRGLMIMVNFTDKKFQTPYDTIDNMLNGENFTRKYTVDYYYQGQRVRGTYTSSGSARKYFQDVSYGQYNPIFDVVGPYELKHDYAYYGSDDDANVGEMIKEACLLADSAGANFKLYDNDNDGKVDFVYVLYAWEGEADGGDENTVWPHNWDLSYTGESCTVDGKKVRNYACSNEWQHYGQVYNGIGTFCHEFSHVMGLPDLYYTSNSGTSPHTLNDWDILDYGPYNNDGNTPPAYSAYERFYCGWLTPRVLKEPELVSLPDLNNNTGKAYLICEGDNHNLVGYNPNPTTFYLLENRQKVGWDKYLPGQGLLITKIQYSADRWASNTVNNSSRNMGVDIIEATPNTTTGRSQTAKATDAYPAGGTSWTDYTNHEVTDVTLSSRVITLRYRYGTQDVENVEDGKAAHKILKDGKVVIIRNGRTYDITGKIIE